MDYRFFLNSLEVLEPIGWSDFEVSMNRDDTYHGMQFEVSNGSLTFYGSAYTYLKDKKDSTGIFSNVIFTAQETCGEEYGELISGRLNFGKYKDTCGNSCTVSIPFEEEGCKVIFKNRFDQKVDVENNIALDDVSVLPDYIQLGQTMEIPAKALQASVDGSVAEDGYEFTVDYSAPGGRIIFIRPDYAIERYNNIATGQLTGGNNCQGGENCSEFITPQLLFEDDIECFDGNFTYTSRMKGILNIPVGSNLFNVQQKIWKWDGVGTLYDDGELVAEGNIFYEETSPPPGALTIEFDNTLTGSVTIPDGIGFYAVLEVGVAVSSPGSVVGFFYEETLFTIEAVKLCPSTDAQYFMIHETLSRITEAITNKCIRVKSEYYGRIDSQPFAFDQDGCGSLRMLTSGLKLRNDPDGKFFTNMKDLMSGLNAIDNIGFDIYPDPDIAGKSILRIEPVSEFYVDQQILFLESIAVVTNEIQEAMHYAKIDSGYKKWEVEQVNGLNEFNSTREYRTNAETISTTLDIQSNLVAGSYPIELTRQQSFAESGAADTTYDNEVFILCLNRNAYDFSVEQGGITEASGIFDPDTVMNFRISPTRNLMRWFKSIINTYPNINSSTSRLFFNAGTGNYTAGGILTDTDCKLENNAIAENENIGVLNFTDQSEATPLFKNETATFEYPLSISEYKQIKDNPYGYIAYTCGQSTDQSKGFIKEIKFRPARGMANFTLIKKWGS